jgi:hypothetical protein
MAVIINSMVEVFKTNVQDEAEAAILVALLQKHITNSCVNFDLDDCDKVLRVAGLEISPQLVAGILNDHGYWCEVLL